MIGAGSFGTALTVKFAAQGHHVTLKTRTQEHLDDIKRNQENKKYLPSIRIPENVNYICEQNHASVQQADIVIFATPTQKTPEIFSETAPYLSQTAQIILTSKGVLQNHTVETPFVWSWLQNNYPQFEVFVLSGPNFAFELAQSLPSAATLAGIDGDHTLALCSTLKSPSFRLYPTTDVVGVSLCGALKNVYAIASGICHGLNLGENARAALLTRALAEMKRLGMTMGADAQTFLGLGGVGDLWLTCQSLQSRNTSFGFSLVNQKNLNFQATQLVEGFYTAKALQSLIRHYDVRMPIANGIYAVLYKNDDLAKAIQHLLESQTVDFEYH